MESSNRFETWKTGFDKLIDPCATTGVNDVPDQRDTAGSSQKASSLLIKCENEASEDEAEFKPPTLPKSESDENDSAKEDDDAENRSDASEGESGSRASLESEGEGNDASKDEDGGSGFNESDNEKSDCETATRPILVCEDPQQFNCSVIEWIKQQAEMARTRILDWATVSERLVGKRLQRARADILRNLRNHTFTDEMSQSKRMTFEDWWAKVYVKDVQEENKSRYNKIQVVGEFFKKCAKNNENVDDRMPDLLTLMNGQDYIWTRYYNWLKTQNAKAHDELSVYVEDYKEKMLGLLKKNVCSFDDLELKDWHEQVLQKLSRPNFKPYSRFLDLDMMLKRSDEAVELARASVVAENTMKVEEELKCVKAAVDYVTECYMKKLKSRIDLNPMLDLALEILHLETDSLLTDAFGKVPDFYYTEVWNLDKCGLALRLIQGLEEVKKYNQEAMRNSQEKLADLKQKRSTQAGRSSCTPEPSVKRPRIDAEVQPGPSTLHNPSGCQGTQCPRWNTFINFKNSPCNHCKSQTRSNGAVGLMIEPSPTYPFTIRIRHLVEWGKSCTIEPTITIVANQMPNSPKLSFIFDQLLNNSPKTQALVNRGQLQSLCCEEALGASLTPFRQQILRRTEFGPQACKNKVAVMVPTSISCSSRQRLKTGLKLAGFDNPVLVQHMTVIGLWYSAAKIENSGDQSLIVTLYLSEYPPFLLEVSLVLVSHILTEPICCQVISTIAERSSHGAFSELVQILDLIDQLRKDAHGLPVPGAYVLLDSRDKSRYASDSATLQKLLTDRLESSDVKFLVVNEDTILSGLLLASKGAKYSEVFPSAVVVRLGSHDVVLTARNSPAKENVEVVKLKKITKHNKIEVSCTYASETKKIKHSTLPDDYIGDVQVVMKSDGCIEISYHDGQAWVKVTDGCLYVDDEEKLEIHRERVRQLYSLPSTRVKY